MTTLARIVVLANSVKHAPGRCIAGKELTTDGVPGKWIRPVSKVGEGQLYAHHMRIAGGGSINLFDVFDVPLLHHCADHAQPENWLIDDTVQWKRVGVWPSNKLTQIYDNPTDLWIEPGAKTDRISTHFLPSILPARSICMISLIQPSISPDYFSPQRDRLAFGYGQQRYDLKITDPFFRRQNGQAAPTGACISLTPAFKDYHFKLAANLIW
jgi:hypothetical protein